MLDSSELIKPQEILADVLVLVGDEGYKLGLTPGFYNERVKQAVHNDLAIPMYVFEEEVDIKYDPVKLQVQLPADMFNPRQVYLHQGICCGGGNDFVILHWHKGLNNAPGGAQYTAERTENQKYDPDYQPIYQGVYNFYNNVYFANISNGVLMLSPNCSGYQYVKIVYNSMGGNYEDIPFVPRIFKNYVLYKCAYDTCLFLMSRDPQKYTLLRREMYNMLYDRSHGYFWEARYLAANVSTWKERETQNHNLNGKWYR
jgi:hypothetical protein